MIFGSIWEWFWGDFGVKNRSKMYKNRSKKRIKRKMQLWIDFERLLCGLWKVFRGVLGRSWPQVGNSWADLGSKLGPKIGQNRSQEPSEMPSFLSSIWRSIFEAIWCQLGSILDPKTLPKWGQVGSKIDPIWSVDLRALFCWMWGHVLLNFVHKIAWPRARMYCKLQYKIDFFDFLIVVLLGCFVAWFLIDFWLILGSKIEQKSIKNRS